MWVICLHVSRVAKDVDPYGFDEISIFAHRRTFAQKPSSERKVARGCVTEGECETVEFAQRNGGAHAMFTHNLVGVDILGDPSKRSIFYEQNGGAHAAGLREFQSSHTAVLWVICLHSPRVAEDVDPYGFDEISILAHRRIVRNMPSFASATRDTR